jgi:hypothetical protein
VLFRSAVPPFVTANTTATLCPVDMKLFIVVVEFPRKLTVQLALAFEV